MTKHHHDCSKRQIPKKTMLCVHREGDIYPTFATVTSPCNQFGCYTLKDELFQCMFDNALDEQNIIIPSDQRYSYWSTTTNEKTLKDSLYALSSEMQTTSRSTLKETGSTALFLFHKRAQASILFENLNSIASKPMSKQPRRCNCALLCSLHDMIATHSLYNDDMFLTNKQPRNFTTEKTAKKFCLATIAFRMATGMNSKIDWKTSSIYHLSTLDPSKYQQAISFIDFFSLNFHPHYARTLCPIKHDVEKFNLHKTKHDLLTKK